MKCRCGVTLNEENIQYIQTLTEWNSVCLDMSGEYLDYESCDSEGNGDGYFACLVCGRSLNLSEDKVIEILKEAKKETEHKRESNNEEAIKAIENMVG